MEFDIDVPDDVSPTTDLILQYMKDMQPKPNRQRFNFVMESKPMVVVPKGNLHG